MSKAKLVSVIMPVYNAQEYLRDAIESMVDQTYKNIELIIINDGSTDSSESIIKEYAEEYPQIIAVSRENRGLIKTLNEEIEMAKGEYIVRMDADDISKIRRIEKQVEFMEEHPDVMMSGCYFEILAEKTATPERLEATYKLQDKINSYDNDMQQDLFMGYTILHATWIIRRELLNNIGVYSEQYSHCEDGELLFRVLANNYKIGVVKERLYQYRIYEASKAGQDSHSNVKDDTMNYRLDFLVSKFGEEFSKKYAIWGYSDSGRNTQVEMQKRFPNAEFVGYIDSFAEAEKEDDVIFRPELLKDDVCNYVVIATHGGFRFARNYLESIEWIAIDDYYSVVETTR